MDVYRLNGPSILLGASLFVLVYVVLEAMGVPQ